MHLYVQMTVKTVFLTHAFHPALRSMSTRHVIAAENRYPGKRPRDHSRILSDPHRSTAPREEKMCFGAFMLSRLVMPLPCPKLTCVVENPCCAGHVAARALNAENAGSSNVKTPTVKILAAKDD